jgi:gliding motility-associated-like protein
MKHDKKYMRYIVVAVLFFIYHNASSQSKQRVTHINGDSIVACVKVNVTSWGMVDRNLNGCPESGPYNIGFNFFTQTSGNGSYTFTFTPAVDSFVLNISGISYLDWGKELVRLYVNGQHYSIVSGSKLNCDALAVLTNDGDITGCYPCGTSAWGDLTVKGSINTLTILDSCAWGYGNGVKASLDIYTKSQLMFPFSIGRDTTLCRGETLLLNASIPHCTYVWQDNSTNPTLTVTKEGLYWVMVTDTCGTTKKDTINIQYKKCNCNIQLPNAFTPNNDSKNDKFPPALDCEFEQYNLKIFNRWGELVFQSSNSTKLWDGSYKGDLQVTGVYVYLLAYKLATGDKKLLSGTITLIR